MKNPHVFDEGIIFLSYFSMISISLYVYTYKTYICDHLLKIQMILVKVKKHSCPYGKRINIFIFVLFTERRQDLKTI